MKEAIYIQKRSGSTLIEIAEEFKVSYKCVRKWWRRANKEGLAGLYGRKRGRKPHGTLSRFSSEIQEMSLNLKRQHKRWGANRVLIEMKLTPGLETTKLPSRSRLYTYYRRRCPRMSEYLDETQRGASTSPGHQYMNVAS